MTSMRWLDSETEHLRRQVATVAARIRKAPVAGDGCKWGTDVSSASQLTAHTILIVCFAQHGMHQLDSQEGSKTLL